MRRCASGKRLCFLRSTVRFTVFGHYGDAGGCALRCHYQTQTVMACAIRSPKQKWFDYTLRVKLRPAFEKRDEAICRVGKHARKSTPSTFLQTSHVRKTYDVSGRGSVTPRKKAYTVSVPVTTGSRTVLPSVDFPYTDQAEQNPYMVQVPYTKTPNARDLTRSTLPYTEQVEPGTYMVQVLFHKKS